ncbi:MAG: FGGY family carbohydrate kinase [Myxococcota bacterium]|jgi:glycerol kinase|nr:FGGY family carbohydrate kinase [Myxococcota bacterium]
MPELILGLDVGTSSARAMVVDLSGRVHGRSQTKIASTHAAPGRAEQDPHAVWRCVEQTIAATLEAAGCKASDLATLGLTTQRSSVVVWDKKTGEPVSPIILWTDLRGIDRAAELAAAGHLALPLAAVSKLEAAIDGAERGRARCAAGELAWGTLDSYLVHCLSGGEIHATDYSNAWSTCYLDIAGLRSWNTAVIEYQGLAPELFPMLCDTYGDLGVTAADRIGAKVPLGAIVADQQSGMFAHDAWERGDWKATYGTSATLMVSTGDAMAFEGGLTPMLQCAKGDQTLFASEGMVVSAGGLLDWLVGELRLFDSVAELVLEAAAVSSADGVAICPALQGLGAPHNDSTRRASIVGLSGASSRGQIARAALESIAFRIREIANGAATIQDLSVPEALPVDGGLAVSDFFLQIQADLLGRPVDRHHEIEATVLGACVAAALGSGLATRDDLAELTRMQTRFEPAIGSDEADERYAQWREATGLSNGG